MLSSLKPANGKFVLGPPVETAPPVVVFTGPADHPDAVAQTASASPKKKKKVAAKTEDGWQAGQGRRFGQAGQDRQAGKAGKASQAESHLGQRNERARRKAPTGASRRRPSR